METVLAYVGHSRDRTGIKKEYAIVIDRISTFDEFREVLKYILPYLAELTSNQYYSNLSCNAF